MTTTILDTEILRLRRRLGDLFNEDGTEITLTADASFVGYSTATGARYKRDELLDIYHDSVGIFIGYCLSALPYKVAARLIPGYFVRLINQTATGGKLVLSALTPPAYKVVDVRKYNGVTANDISYEISPDQLMSAENGRLVNHLPSATNIRHCVMGDSAAAYVQTLFMFPTSVTAIDLIYVRQHPYLVHTGAADLVGITSEGLRRIQIIAEAEARRYKSQDIKELPELLLGDMFKYDMKGEGNAVNS